MISKAEKWSALAFFLVVSLVVFGASLSHGFSTVDDPYLVSTNIYIHGLTARNIAYVFTHFDPELYIPFTFLSYQLNYLIAGLSPGIYHLTNILLHGLNGFLVACVAFKLIKRKWIAVLAGTLFLVHPLNTEAVVWVAGRKDLLSTCFLLLSVVSYLKFKEGNSKYAYLASLCWFLFALLSKAMVLTLPVILIGIDLTQGQKISVKSLLNKIPYAVLSVIFGVIAILGKERIVASSSLLETVLMAGKSTVFYLQKLLMPINLSPFYPYAKQISLSSPDFYVPLMVLGALIIAIILTLRKTRMIALSFAIFFVALSPTFLNFHKGETMFFAVDRYAYLPAISLLILTAVGFSKIYDRADWNKRSKTTILPAAIVVVLGIFSLLQTNVWRSDELLFAKSIEQIPDNVPARVSLALIYRETGRQNLERSVLENGIKIQDNIAYHLGIGSVDQREGKFDSARREYEKAKAMDPKNPEPLFYLGSLAEAEGKSDEALRLYAEAVALDESYVSPMINAGAIELDAGNYAEAEKWLKQALVWNPNSFEVQYNLFMTLQYQKKTAESLEHLEAAYELNREDKDIALSFAYAKYEAKEFEKAEEILTRLLKADASNATASRLLNLVRKESMKK